MVNVTFKTKNTESIQYLAIDSMETQSLGCRSMESKKAWY
ncbi:hypothetical protein BTN50_1039 [Candidatus Enterovibrio altilux]|uniref:Uncharacterized protein n=1 Tax=Candidatus Enterovibrio altilux TaxID=1927128 RepID=A0A291B984_9GAMM|nr:hypothetical protein BTN50_1039 [Candidatus Enterovibrio luxaltus]